MVPGKAIGQPIMFCLLYVAMTVLTVAQVCCLIFGCWLAYCSEIVWAIYLGPTLHYNQYRRLLKAGGVQ